jgi:hypothetical protein
VTQAGFWTSLRALHLHPGLPWTQLPTRFPLFQQSDTTTHGTGSLREPYRAPDRSLTSSGNTPQVVTEASRLLSRMGGKRHRSDACHLIRRQITLTPETPPGPCHIARSSQVTAIAKSRIQAILVQWRTQVHPRRTSQHRRGLSQHFRPSPPSLFPSSLWLLSQTCSAHSLLLSRNNQCTVIQWMSAYD